MREMKIIKERKLGQKDWYALYVGDDYVMGSYDEEKINLFFEEIKKNPELHLHSREVIKSEKINIE